MRIIVNGGDMSQKEKFAYVDHIRKQHPGMELMTLTITLDGDYVDLMYQLSPIKFQRIRRITGYLVGTLDRFNDAKASEVKDRVKHSMLDIKDS